MNVPSAMVALTGEKVRWRFAELATEAVMVVFAVLVALGVEEWREKSGSSARSRIAPGPRWTWRFGRTWTRFRRPARA